MVQWVKKFVLRSVLHLNECIHLTSICLVHRINLDTVTVLSEKLKLASVTLVYIICSMLLSLPSSFSPFRINFS
jgi:hypothetical protein